MVLQIRRWFYVSRDHVIYGAWTTRQAAEQFLATLD